jgi:hypothetical protein
MPFHGSKGSRIDVRRTFSHRAPHKMGSNYAPQAAGPREQRKTAFGSWPKKPEWVIVSGARRG